MKVSWNLTLLSNYGVYIEFYTKFFFIWVMNGIELNGMRFNETEHILSAPLLNFVYSALT